MKRVKRGWAALAVIVALAVAGWVHGSNDAASAAEASGPRLRFGVATPGGPLATAEATEVRRLAGEAPTLELSYSDFDQPAPVAGLAATRSRGADPMVTWEPWRWGAGVDQPQFALTRIIAGDHDAVIRAWARDLAAWGHPVYLRFAHEMNGDWYPWAQAANGNRPGDYVEAWRHVHAVVTAEGARNVRWVWAPNVPYPASVPLPDLYPGNDVVDVVALDAYNWGTAVPWSSWTKPRALLEPGLKQLRALAPGKPIMITETSSAEAGGSKPDWIKNLVSYLTAQADVTAFVWFHQSKETDWRINSTTSSATALARALANRR